MARGGGGLRKPPRGGKAAGRPTRARPERGRTGAGHPGKSKSGAPASRSRSAASPARGKSGAPASRGARPAVRPGAAKGIRGVDRARTAYTTDHGIGGSQIEGRQAVRELLIAQRRRVLEIWVSDDLEDNQVIDDIVDLASAQRVPLRRVKRKDIDRDARSEAPQGILAKAEPIAEFDLAELLRDTKSPQFYVAVDGVTDPGNLGAILRCCDGAGVTGVILPRHRAVHITPTAAKSAAGAAEYVPMCVVGGLPTALKQMKDSGVWVIGLDDSADRSIFEMGSLARESVCIVLGAEGTGLSRLVRERCDVLVSIPMFGALSSLNVSVATALATYEVVRARRAPDERSAPE